MTRPTIVILLVAALAVAARFLLFPGTDRAPVQARLALMEAMGEGGTEGFERAIDPRTFSFPWDHGPHPGFRTEWWYFTGNFATTEGRPFGYQFTLFRNGLAASPPPRASAWAAHEVYMGHLGVTDVEEGRFHSFERFSRGALGLAGARAEPFRVWLEDWVVEETGTDDESAPLAVRIRARAEGVALRLELSASRPVVLQGKDGLSAKGPEPGNASYYYSITRLETEGTVTLDGQQYPVRGLSWLDREWSTSALSADLDGWDWFSLQLSDGADLMYYQLRRKQGDASGFSKGKLVFPDGRDRTLDREEVRLQALDTWESPLGGVYPSAWRIEVPGDGLDLEVFPVLADQEHDFYIRYWEGAVTVEGTRAGETVTGTGYVELTGYDEK